MPSNVISQEVFSGNPFNFAPPAPVNPEEKLPVAEEIVIQDPNPKGNPDEDYGDYMDEEVQENEPNLDEDSDVEPLDLDQEEVASSLYDAFKTLGYITDEKELPKVKSVTEFLVNYEKYKANKLEESIREEYKEAYSDEKLQYIDYLMKGGSPEAISSFYQFATLPIDDDESDSENRKALILAMYKDKGLNDKRATNLYSTAYDDGEDLEEAKTAKDYFKDKHNAKLKEIQAQEAEELQQTIDQNDQLVSSLKTILKDKKVGNVELTEDEVKNLEPYMFGQNVITDIIDPRTGQTYKGKVSQYYVDYQNFFKKPESLIKLARFIKSNGEKLDDKEKIKEELSEELIIKLNGFKGKNNQGSRPNRKNAFLT